MIEEDLDDLAADAHHLAQCFFEIGEAYFNKGNYTMAISQYSFAIKLNQREPTYYILRAMAHQYNRQYTLAVKDYTTVIFLCPDDLKPVLLRGICFLSWTRYNSAIKDFDTYISKAPDNAHAYFYRGLTNKGLGKFKETIQDLRKAAWLGDKEAIVELNKIKDF